MSQAERLLGVRHRDNPGTGTTHDRGRAARIRPEEHITGRGDDVEEGQ